MIPLWLSFGVPMISDCVSSLWGCLGAMIVSLVFASGVPMMSYGFLLCLGSPGGCPGALISILVSLSFPVVSIVLLEGFL